MNPVPHAVVEPESNGDSAHGQLTVALAGNPNTGKTTLFNALSGLNQRVGNYPGVTVDIKKGRCHSGGRCLEIVDLPGTYSLSPRSPDEMVAVDVILGKASRETPPDVIVAIVDASNLERNLYLVTQLMELGRPIVVALNMVDIAAGQGIQIDAARLSRQLGLPIVRIQANKSQGLEALTEAIAAVAAGGEKPAGPAFPDPVIAEERRLRKRLGDDVPDFLIRRLLLDVGGYIEERFRQRLKPEVIAESRGRLREAGCPIPQTEARVRYDWIRTRAAGCIERAQKRPRTWTDKIDRWTTHRVYGTVIFMALMFLVFESLFAWAKLPMDLIDQGREWLAGTVQASMSPGPFRALLIDGVFKGVGSVLVFLPQIMILFGFIAILEDCGYMARAAFLMDRLMSRCGLSGKSFIPLLSSVACAVPGIMATRVIENRRDRLATILVAPLMSCSARLPVYTLLIGAFLTEGFAWWVPGLVMFLMYMIGFVTAPLVALLLKRSVLRGETPAFVMEMPLYKWPMARTVLRRMLDSGWAFVRRAGTLILASMILVWALLYFPATDSSGRSYEARVAQLEASNHPEQARELEGQWRRDSWLGRTGQAIEPAVRPLGWDWRIGMAALASFPAREVVVGTLGMIYADSAGGPEGNESKRIEGLGQSLRGATWQGDPHRKVFSTPTALALMVFFALCCQCSSTLAVIRRETGSWRWPAFTFVYMTGLAYVAALVVFQIGSRLAA
jgi:ferrous iron transport protein B